MGRRPAGAHFRYSSLDLEDTWSGASIGSYNCLDVRGPYRLRAGRPRFAESESTVRDDSRLVTRGEGLFRMVPLTILACEYPRLSTGTALQTSLALSHAEIRRAAASHLERGDGRRHSAEFAYRRRPAAAAPEWRGGPSQQRHRSQLPPFSASHTGQSRRSCASPGRERSGGGRRETARRHTDRRSCPHWRERGGVGGRAGERDERRHSRARPLASSSPTRRLRVTGRHPRPFSIL